MTAFKSACPGPGGPDSLSANSTTAGPGPAMKLGPLHVIRDATFRELHESRADWERVHGALAAAAGTPLAGRALEHANELLHSPLGARVAPAALPPEPADDDPS